MLLINLKEGPRLIKRSNALILIIINYIILLGTADLRIRLLNS